MYRQTGSFVNLVYLDRVGKQPPEADFVLVLSEEVWLFPWCCLLQPLCLSVASGCA